MRWTEIARWMLALTIATVLSVGLAAIPTYMFFRLPGVPGSPPLEVQPALSLPPLPLVWKQRFELIYKQRGVDVKNIEGRASAIWDVEVLHDRETGAEIICAFQDKDVSCFLSGRSWR